MILRSLFAGAALASAVFSPSAPAQMPMNGHDHPHAPAATATAAPDSVNAEVRAIDLPRRRITLRHEAHAGMPPMTMSFALAAGLAVPPGLKAGERVQVTLQDIDGTQTVTRLTR
ncbi:MAG: copper-binding protein [Candidatus Dactylopiibacterium sp.]|nr:copper-binding protein [Candidatus Dactylopiibacterium sp.]